MSPSVLPIFPQESRRPPLTDSHQALYALELFSWDDPNQKISFVVTLLLVAGTTYGFAGYLIWFVREPKRRRRLKKVKRVKRLGKLFKRQKKKKDESNSDTYSESEDSD
jgi:hypothetical protein